MSVPAVTLGFALVMILTALHDRRRYKRHLSCAYGCRSSHLASLSFSTGVLYAASVLGVTTLIGMVMS